MLPTAVVLVAHIHCYKKAEELAERSIGNVTELRHVCGRNITVPHSVCRWRHYYSSCSSETVAGWWAENRGEVLVKGIWGGAVRPTWKMPWTAKGALL